MIFTDKTNNKEYKVSSGFRTIKLDNEEIEVTAITLTSIDGKETNLGIIFRVEGNITLFNTFEIPFKSNEEKNVTALKLNVSGNYYDNIPFLYDYEEHTIDIVKNNYHTVIELSDKNEDFEDLSNINLGSVENYPDYVITDNDNYIIKKTSNVLPIVLMKDVKSISNLNTSVKNNTWYVTEGDKGNVFFNVLNNNTGFISYISSVIFVPNKKYSNNSFYFKPIEVAKTFRLGRYLENNTYIEFTNNSEFIELELTVKDGTIFVKGSFNEEEIKFTSLYQISDKNVSFKLFENLEFNIPYEKISYNKGYGINDELIEENNILSVLYKNRDTFIANKNTVNIIKNDNIDLVSGDDLIESFGIPKTFVELNLDTMLQLREETVIAHNATSSALEKLNNIINHLREQEKNNYKGIQLIDNTDEADIIREDKTTNDEDVKVVDIDTFFS